MNTADTQRVLREHTQSILRTRDPRALIERLQSFSDVVMQATASPAPPPTPATSDLAILGDHDN